MSIRLMSNRDHGDPWMGTDTDLVFGGVNMCMAITCLVDHQGERRLAGAHLIPLSSRSEFRQCLKQFATIARRPHAIWVIARMAKWMAGADDNNTELTYDPFDGGTLLKAIWEALKFRGDIKVYDLERLRTKAQGYDIHAKSLTGAAAFHTHLAEQIDMNEAVAIPTARSVVAPDQDASHGCRCVVM